MTARQQLTRAACSLHYAASRHDALTRRTDVTADSIYAFCFWRWRVYGKSPAVAAALSRAERAGYLAGQTDEYFWEQDLVMARYYGEIDAPVKL